MDNEGRKPCEALEDGLELEGGWKVIEKINKGNNATGGTFSSGYKVKKDNIFGYLKALDFSSAFKAPDMPEAMYALTKAFIFERDLLKKCKDKKLSKIVTAIADGSVLVSGYVGEISRVYYIIFNFADGDIRKIKDTFERIDLVFAFRSLHNIAVGLQQLHTNEIAHQDLKPSNILAFQKDYKISDLGNSSDKNKEFENDKYQIPGDPNYCPIEQIYDYHCTNDFNEKIAADMYLFGSLFFFFFTGFSASQVIIKKSEILKISLTENFDNDIAEWERVYTEVLSDFKRTIQSIISDDKLIEEIFILVRNLCHPDPRKRGHYQNVAEKFNKYGLDRVISRLDYIAKKAEMKLI